MKFALHGCGDAVCKIKPVVDSDGSFRLDIVNDAGSAIYNLLKITSAGRLHCYSGLPSSLGFALDGYGKLVPSA